MKSKVLLSLLVLFTLSSNAKVYIPLVKSVLPTTNSGGDARIGARTSSSAPLSYIDKGILSINYSISTISSIIITNDSTGAVVFSKSIDEETNNVRVELKSFVKKENAYNISVNAFGNWWVGYFGYYDYEYSNTDLEKTIQKGFSGVVESPGTARNYGVYAIAGNAAPGWNYGVSGIVSGQNAGTGVYGSSVRDEGFYTGGRFAGLFHGDLKTTDAVIATAYHTLADNGLNKDMVELESSSLDNLMQMGIYRYYLQQFIVDGGDESKPLGYYNNDSGILEKEHFGLSGQELKKIYPDLVTENQDGYLSINYIEIVPLLIRSVQELKTELDRTNAQLEELQSVTHVSERTSGPKAALYQNIPNPFKERCTVKCTIPTDVKDAMFYLYDYSGRQIQSRDIKDRGNVQIVIEGNGLEAGIYLYSLVTDGEIVDTRRIVHIE